MSEKYQQAKRITIVGIIVNGLLSVIKLLVGYFGHSQALIADGVHSFSDLITDGMVLLATRAANQAPDSDHPYGHGRIETMASVVLAVVLLFVGLGIALESLKAIFSGAGLDVPDVWVLVIAFISVVANEGLFQVTMRVGKRIRSELLKTNAWHNRVDALSSLVVLFGAFLSIIGLSWGDAIAALIVAMLILKMAAKMIWRNAKELVDTGVNEAMQAKIEKAVADVDGVKAVHQLRSRLLAGEVYLDLHIQVSPLVSVSEGHFISDQVMKVLHTDFKDIKDVTVHVDSEDDHEDQGVQLQAPSRREIEAHFKQCLPDISNACLHLVLHYIHERLVIECWLPMAMASEERELNDRLSKCFQTLYEHATLQIVYVESMHLK